LVKIAMPTRSRRFEGKVAFITGASERGIGGAIAERLAEEGCHVCLAGVVRPERLLKRLSRMAPQSIYVECDVTNDLQVRQAINSCASELGGLHIVINNAGIERLHPIESFPEEDSRDLLEVNLHGAIRVSRAALAHLQEGAAIINIASALALGGCSTFSVYSATKAGLIGLTQSLAMELASRRIRVVAVAPALVASPMTFRHLKNLSEAGAKQLEAAHPLGTGSPHDVAAVVAFLSSDDARFISGITVPVGFMSQFALPVDHFTEPQGSVDAELLPFRRAA
jgi:NAD(P)-dependent dehydrogenase (short-subunit alcohol dehydrogenase family)